MRPACMAAIRSAMRSAAGHQLSGGLAQCAATAHALIGDAPLLLTDEPATGLGRDPVDRTVDEPRCRVDDPNGTKGTGPRTI